MSSPETRRMGTLGGACGRGLRERAAFSPRARLWTLCAAWIQWWKCFSQWRCVQGRLSHDQSHVKGARCSFFKWKKNVCILPFSDSVVVCAAWHLYFLSQWPVSHSRIISFSDPARFRPEFLKKIDLEHQRRSLQTNGKECKGAMLLPQSH